MFYFDGKFTLRMVAVIVLTLCSELRINYSQLLQYIPEVVRHPLFEVPYPQLKRGQQSLGALVAVVRPFRYIYSSSDSIWDAPKSCMWE